jgi:O-antigen/teichoic acid export membrane protein
LWIAPQYLSAIPIINVLSWILFFIFPSVWLDYVLVAFNKQKQDFGITLLSAILNVFLNFLLIPRFGILGAAYASIFSQGCNTLSTFIYARFIISSQLDGFKKLDN